MQALPEVEMVKWAETDSDVLHYARIAQESLKAIATLRPYLTVTLRDKTIVCGWLDRLTQGNNADEGAWSIPTSWRGSIILRVDEGEIELDFLDIDAVRASTPPTPSVKQDAGNGGRAYGTSV